MKSGIKKLRTLLLIAFTMACLCGLSTSAASTDQVKLTGTCDYTKAYEVLNLVNDERSAQGLSSLTMDRDLLDAAMQRAAETAIYFSHTRPSGSSCFTVSGKAKGENIAAGQAYAFSVMDSWMNSSGHRSNILESRFTSIGVGCFIQGGVTFWVQIFGTSSAEKVSQPSNAQKTFTVELDADLFSPYLCLNSENDFKVKAGKKDTLEVDLVNPGWTYVCTALDNDSFTWESSSSCAAVSKKGVVTGVSEGTSTISATGPGGHLKASHKVTVSRNLTTSIKSLSNTSDGITVKWNKSPSAKGYYIYRKKSSGSYKKIKTIKNSSTLSYTDKAVRDKNGTAYTYKVVPYSGSTKGSGATKKTVRLTGTTLSSVRNTASRKMTVKWKRASGITGYQIQYSTSRTFKSGKHSVRVSSSKVRKEVASLKKGKTYYVRIRTYKKVSGKRYYSAWSDAKKVKIKK